MKKKLLCVILILFIILPQVSMRSEAASGKWKKDAKGYYYVYSNGSHSKKGWKTISGKKYYFNAKGYRVTGWKKINGKKYHFNAKGVMQTGWGKLSGKKYYFGKNGAMVTGWKKIGKKKYYFSAKGVLNTKTTLKIKGYKFRKDGSLKTCSHKWVWATKEKTIHHDAVTHQEPVYDYTDGHYEYVEHEWIQCNTCVSLFSTMAEYKSHACFPGCTYSTTTTYDEKYYPPKIVDYKTVVDQKAYDEYVEVNDYQYCSLCGKKK